MANKFFSGKEVIVKKRGNLEALYYLVLFSLALIASVVMMTYAISKQNKGMLTYFYIIAPLFTIAIIVSLRFYLCTANPIYTRDAFLYAKKFFRTRKIAIDNLYKITVATFDNDHKVSVKISFDEKAVKYRFKHLDKESAAKLRKLAK